ncbi:MAG TPA: glycosyltransferase family 2 protein [Vicinamibacterales bacterium]|jgi:polyisoprenyl-phosphate glycosyltransferase|nr:glycosyltransferase family 2 protein [Vicinamibacterales bacterium]
MRLSIGIPVYNEEEVLPELLARLTRVLDQLPGGPHEIVFVDDGSTDRSRQLLLKAAMRDVRIKVVVLSRNFGHQAALSAALDHASGDALVLMDADLQDEPEVIPEFVRLHEAGADVVFARRASRKEGWLLQLAYKTFYRLIARLSEIALPLDSGDFALLGSPVVEAIRRLPEQQRYLRGLRAWVGFTQIGVDVQRPARFAGQPKYSTMRLIKLALDGICSFSVVPLRAAALAGLVAILAASIFSLYAVYVRLVQGSVPEGFTASLLVMTFLSGVQLFFVGVIGEYVGRVYGETKRRPAYVVANVAGGDD